MKGDVEKDAAKEGYLKGCFRFSARRMGRTPSRRSSLGPPPAECLPSLHVIFGIGAQDTFHPGTTASKRSPRTCLVELQSHLVIYIRRAVDRLVCNQTGALRDCCEAANIRHSLGPLLDVGRAPLDVTNRPTRIETSQDVSRRSMVLLRRKAQTPKQLLQRFTCRTPASLRCFSFASASSSRPP